MSLHLESHIALKFWDIEGRASTIYYVLSLHQNKEHSWK